MPGRWEEDYQAEWSTLLSRGKALVRKDCGTFPGVMGGMWMMVAFMKCAGKHTVELLLETLNHGSWKGLALLPDINQLSDLVLHI